jgi:hypothetical protein
MERIVSEIDAEIARLEEAKLLLSGGTPGKRGPGRPRKTAGASTPAKKRRKLSAAARAKISAAQKARWAKVKKMGAKSPAAVKSGTAK